MAIWDRFLKAKKKDEYPSYLPFGNYGTPKWSTNNDEAYIKEAYNKIVWVYTCASIISSNFSRVPWELYRKGKTAGTKDKEIIDHPILNIVNSKVNNHWTAKEFMELWALSLALQGKFYAKMNSSVFPTQLYPLYPHMTKPIPDKLEFVKGFEYRISSETLILPEKEVLWSKFVDPLDYYEGLSPIKAMARTIDTENNAVDWNKSQLQNQAIPAGAIQVQNPSPELQKKLRAEWLKNYSGSRNARIPLILNSEKASYVPFGLDPVDMDFINQRKLSRIEICAGFKVPSQVAGDPEGQTYANYNEAVKSLWEQCIIPDYLDRVKDALNLYLASRYADNLELRYNLDDVGALQESLNDKTDRALKLYQGGLISQNDGRFMAGFDEVEGGEQFKKEPTPQNQQKDLKKKALNMNIEQQEMYWKQVEDDREQYEKDSEEEFQQLFEAERLLVIAAILNQQDITEVIQGLSIEKQNTLIKLYNEVIKDFGNQVYFDVGRPTGNQRFDVNEAMREYINTTTASQVVKINETTVNQIQQRIQLGVSEGLSIQNIAKLVDDLYLEQIIPNRSTVIARTETISASNYGSEAGAIQAQEDFDLDLLKFWIPTFDARTRDTHARMSSHKAIGLKEKFKVGDSLMSFPGDFSGSAKEVISCRCTLGYKSK